MYCKKCGNEVKDGETFCAKCGTPTGKKMSYAENNMSKKDTVVAKAQTNKLALVGPIVFDAILLIIDVVSCSSLREELDYYGDGGAGSVVTVWINIGYFLP